MTQTQGVGIAVGLGLIAVGVLFIVFRSIITKFLKRWDSLTIGTWFAVYWERESRTLAGGIGAILAGLIVLVIDLADIVR